MNIDINQKRAKPDRTDTLTNEDVYLVYSAGAMREFRVPADTPVTLDTQRFHRQDRRTGVSDHFPNAQVKDSVIQFEICDFVDEIVSRCEPVDLAKALISDEYVRENLVYALAERYSGEGITHADRIKFFAKVGQAVHDERLEPFMNRFAKSEFAEAEKFSFWDQSNAVNRVLEEAGVMTYRHVKDADGKWVREQIPLRIAVQKDMNIGSEKWNEARDHWRKRLEELFPAPNDEVRAALMEGLRLYATSKLLANDQECGPWINRVRTALGLSEGASE